MTDAELQAFNEYLDGDCGLEGDQARYEELASWDGEAQVDLELHEALHPDGYRG